MLRHLRYILFILSVGSNKGDLMQRRWLSGLVLLLVIGCNSGNTQSTSDCVLSPGLCSDVQVCNVQTHACEPAGVVDMAVSDGPGMGDGGSGKIGRAHV